MKMSYSSVSIPRSFSLISVVQCVSDILVVFLIASCIGFIHLNTLSGRRVDTFLGVLVIFLITGGASSLYHSWRGVAVKEEAALILKVWTISMLLASVILFFVPALEGDYALWYLVSCPGLLVGRGGIRLVSYFIHRMGIYTRSVVLAGTLPAGVELMESFRTQLWLGFVVRGIYNPTDPHQEGDFPWLGNLENLVQDARRGELDCVYIAMEQGQEDVREWLIRKLMDTPCSVVLVPDVFTFSRLQTYAEEINGITVMPLFNTPLKGLGVFLKRVVDITASAVILLLILPLLLGIACAIKMTSPGTVIFRQTRYGMDGKPIIIWKFRTMNVSENSDVVIQAVKNDSRVTRIGSFLRRTSLDELPQFFNVLSGSMSIVGPRPHAVAHNEQYRNIIEGYMLRHKVKPGITGWAQINGWRGETDTLEKMEKRIEFDLEYIRQWSLWLDMKIIWLTIFRGFTGHSAY